MKKRIVLMLCCVLSAVSGLQAQQLTDAKVPLDPAVKVGVLPNGLTYYIRHNEWPEKRVDFYIAQKVGSMQEEENQRGLAHFLEHMCFNGTTHFPGDALKQYLERIGVKFGENLNAYTSFDETVYNINNVNVEIPGALDSCLLILHDWSHDLLLDGKEIDEERGVINEEWRLRRSAMMRMQERAFHKLYEGSRYADRMPIGTMEVVMNFPYEAIRSYYRRWYRPDLQGIVIVGDVNVDEMEQKIKQMFADIQPAPADAPVREYFPVADNKEPLIAIEKDKEQPNALAMMFFKVPAFPNEQKDQMVYLLNMYLKEAFQGMIGARLQEIAQKADAPFAMSYASFDDYWVSNTCDAVNGVVVLKEGRYLDGVTALYRELLRAKRGGFTISEYERFKEEYLSQVDAQYEGRDKVENTSYVNDYVRHFLDAEPAPSIEWVKDIAHKLVPQIPVEAVNQLAAMLPEDNRAIAFFLPEKDGVEYPTEQQVKDALVAVDAEQIDAYAEEVSSDPLVPELSSSVTVKKVKDDVYGAQLITLSNGIRVHVLKTDYSPNNISMQAVSWGGSSLYPNSEYNLVDNASLVQVGGWGQFSAIDLQKKLSGKQASVSPSIGDRTESLYGGCVKKDLETMLQLTYLCFTSPRQDDEAYNSLLERVRNGLKNQDMAPATALKDSMASVVYNNNVRAIRMRAEDLDDLSYDRIMEIYKERYANAADFDFYFVGDVDADSITPLLTKYLGSLPVTKKSEKYRMVDQRMTKGERTCIFEKEQ
ncbi:MAG: insulinase family protein, partial [Bacteroidaceae bacterium]